MYRSLTIIFVLAFGCSRGGTSTDESETGALPSNGASPQASTTAGPAPRVMSEPEEVRDVIRALWPYVKKVDEADFRWARCSDRTVGFDATRSCLEEVLKEVEALRSRMPAKLQVQTSCGKDAEQAHRSYIDGRVSYLRDELAWLKNKAITLKRLMSSKPLSEAWSAMGDAGDDRPISIGEKYSKGLLVVTKNRCISKVFTCPSLGCTSDRLNDIAGTPR